ncbi:MAG: hypothetical protein NTY19_27400 [Planctomycetota bacterium]|nr:hypothetical protein [Planctomycetota bacterium]
MNPSAAYFVSLLLVPILAGDLLAGGVSSSTPVTASSEAGNDQPAPPSSDPSRGEHEGVPNDESKPAISAADRNTLVSIGTAIVVLAGVYAVFGILRLFADVAIFLIALADAVLAFNIHHWYAPVAKEVSFLPQNFNLTAWGICVIALAIAGAVVALPLVPFSSINRPNRSSTNSLTSTK